MVLAGGSISNQPFAGIAIGIFLMALGGVLALDVRKISTFLHQQHERRGREKDATSSINWYIVGGRGFLAFGVLFLIIGIVYAA